MSKGKDKIIKELWKEYAACEFDDCGEEETEVNRRKILTHMHHIRISNLISSVMTRKGE